MSYIDLIVINSALVTTIIAIISCVISLANPNWRYILVCMEDTPVLDGTEGLWKYCEDESGDCINLNTEDTGEYKFITA